MDDIPGACGVTQELFAGSDGNSANFPSLSEFDLDSFDTELNLDENDLENLDELCRDITGSDFDHLLDSTSIDELGGAFGGRLSGSSSESEDPGSFFGRDAAPLVIASPSVAPDWVNSVSVDKVTVLLEENQSAEACVVDAEQPQIVQVASTKNEVRTAVPMILGKAGLVLNATAGQTLRVVRRADADGSVRYVLERRSSAENLALESAGVCEVPEFLGAALTGSPSSTEGCDEDPDDGDEFQPLNLTDEEKKIMMQENITLPNRYPLTREEERDLRRIRRKIRNKRSAQNSRKRKQQYVDDLEKRVKTCSEEKAVLQERVTKLERENASLMAQLRNVRSAMTRIAGKAAPTSTAFLIVVMSVAMLMAPNLKTSSSKWNELMGGSGQAALVEHDPTTSVGLEPSSMGLPKRVLLSDTLRDRDRDPVAAGGLLENLDKFFKQLEELKTSLTRVDPTAAHRPSAPYYGTSYEYGGMTPKRRKKTHVVETVANALDASYSTEIDVAVEGRKMLVGINRTLTALEF